MSERGAAWKSMASQVIERKPLKLLDRSEWSAQPPRYSKPLDLPATKIFLVGTNRPPCYSERQCTMELQKLQNFHMKITSIPDIRYNFVISSSGTVYEGRGWKESPSLPQAYDALTTKSLFIAFTGDFRDPKLPVPAEMLDSMELLFKLGLEYKYLSPDFETFDL